MLGRFGALGEAVPNHGRNFTGAFGGDRRSGRIEAHHDYLLGLVRRSPDLTLLEIRERLIANCGERFAVSVLWRFFDGFVRVTAGRLRMAQHAQTEAATRPRGRATRPTRRLVFVCKLRG